MNTNTLHAISFTREQLDTLGDALDAALRGLINSPKNSSFQEIGRDITDLQLKVSHAIKNADAGIDEDVPF